MASDRFRAGIVFRIVSLILAILLVAGAIEHTRWYFTIAVLAAICAAQVLELMHFVTRSSRELARFIEAISFDDLSQTFSGLHDDRTFRDLGAAMAKVQDRLRLGRSEREEQSRYLQTLIAHVPVGLVSVDEGGKVQLLNMAARRLFETALTEVAQLSRFGQAFAVGLETLEPGSTAIVRMERSAGTLQLKAAAAGLNVAGTRRRIISLQNIESEMSAQEMAAWQTVIRVMAHEVMNSLTPVASLAATARDGVGNVLKGLPIGDPNAAALTEAGEALEIVARRSHGLLSFVHNHRRLTKRLVTNFEVIPVQRVFARLERLLANDLAARNIQLTATVEPGTLEITADADLLDQALINLVRNAIEALHSAPAGRIALSAQRQTDGRVAIVVADNGPGIALEQRDKVFVPFFTTKRGGSGVGLTLVRQVATVHGASVGLEETSGGGATLIMRF
jgi:two-component system, NtrC family, nitrogen regulation sensor histidine kinase NtrY